MIRTILYWLGAFGLLLAGMGLLVLTGVLLDAIQDHPEFGGHFTRLMLYLLAYLIPTILGLLGAGAGIAMVFRFVTKRMPDW